MLIAPSQTALTDVKEDKYRVMCVVETFCTHPLARSTMIRPAIPVVRSSCTTQVERFNTRIHLAHVPGALRKVVRCSKARHWSCTVYAPASG